MSLNTNDLKDTMKDSVNNLTDSSAAMTALGNAIANYILNNIEFVFAWTATNSVSPYDVENTTPSGEMITLIITLSPSGSTDSSTSLSQFGSQITTGIQSGTLNITEAGYTTTPVTWSNIPVLSISMNQETTPDAAFLSISNQIIDWLTDSGNKPSASCAGSHGTYVGAGTVSSVS